MTDKKLTDNEIIKVLEHFKSYFLRRKTADTDWTTTIGDVLDLINSQKAEIERLKAEAQMADGYADALEERAKSEAIKEFAERLKDYLKEHAWIWCSEVDNLVKEMVGEDNA
jgi:hypothetical protein